MFTIGEINLCKMVQSKLFLILQIIFATAINTIKTKNISFRTFEPIQENYEGNIDTDIENEIHINNINDTQRDTFEVETKFQNNNEEQIETFTDFIQAVINILIKFDDFKLQQFFTVVNDEARKYHYRGCKFYELIDNHDFRKFLGRTLTDFKMQPPIDIRNILEAVAYKLKYEIFDEKQKAIINIIKALYNKDSLEKFNNFLNNIKAYNKNTRKNFNIAAVVKKGLRSIIFNHYSQLNKNARMAFTSALNDYWNYFEEMSTFEPDVTPPKLRSLRKTTPKINENIKNNFNGTIRRQGINKRKSFLYPIALLMPKYDDIVNEMPNKYKQKYYDHNTERTETTYTQSSDNFNDNGPYNYEYNFKFSKTPLWTEDDLDAYEYLTSTRKKVKWLTFKTLYPEFEDKWLTTAKTNANDYRKSLANKAVTSDDFLSAQQHKQASNNDFHKISKNNNSIIEEERVNDDKKKYESIDNDVVAITNLIQNEKNELDNPNTQVRNDTEIIDLKSKDSSNNTTELHSNYSVMVTDKSTTDILDKDVNVEYDYKG